MKQDAAIAQDEISLLFFALSSSMLIFIFLSGEGFTAPLAFGTIVAIILMVMGVAGSFLFGFRPGEQVINEKAALSIGLGFVLALAGFLLFNAFIPTLTVVSPQSVIAVKTFFGTFNLSIAGIEAGAAAFIFAVILIPTAEENFFRGFFANLFISRTGKFVGILLSAIVFVIFHIPAYGYDYFTLGIIFADGLVIAAVDVETGRISTGILAHVGNNALSYITVTGAVVLPSALTILGAPGGQVLSLPLMLGIYVAVRVHKRGKLF